MFLILALIICFSLLVWLQVRWGRVKRYWTERNVSHRAPHFIMGSLTFLQKENPAKFMVETYQNFKNSPYVGIWLFWRPALIINSPDLARKVLVKDSDIFRNKFASSGKTDPTGRLALFAVKDPMWSSIRRRLTTVFTAAKLRTLQGLTLRKANDLVQRIKCEMQNGGINNLRMVYNDFTTDVFGEAAFGVLSEATRTGDSIMRKVTRDFMKFSIHRGLSWCSIFFFPELVDVFRFSLFPKDTIEYLRQVLREVVDQRDGDKYTHGDLLDALLKMKREANEDGEEISDDVLLAQAALFLLGAFDTSGAALTWTTLELSHQPQLQERLYSELFEAKQKIGGKDFDPATLAELPYLNAVFKEALRKFPPMGWLDRIAARNYKLDDSLTIQAGTAVYVNAVGMHWDPEYFPEPEKFDPDRFMPENEANIKPYTYMPFGEGPRICIGMRFAYQTIRYALSTIFLNYQVRPLPTTPKANDVHVEKKGMFLLPDQKIPLQFKPR